MKVESIELSNFTISVQNTVRFILIPTIVTETQSWDGLQKDGGMWWMDREQGLGRPGFLSRLVLTLGCLGQKDSLSKKWGLVDSWNINLPKLQHSSFGNSFYSGVFLLNDPSWTKLCLYFHVTLLYK